MASHVYVTQASQVMCAPLILMSVKISPVRMGHSVRTKSMDSRNTDKIGLSK